MPNWSGLRCSVEISRESLLKGAEIADGHMSDGTEPAARQEGEASVGPPDVGDERRERGHDGSNATGQNAAFRGVRGNGITSRTFAIPVT